MSGHGRREVAIGELQVRAARYLRYGRLEPVDLLGLEPVDRMWQNPNRIPAAQGPVAMVTAVRRRLT
jgi:hypothetical protein